MSRVPLQRIVKARTVHGAYGVEMRELRALVERKRVELTRPRRR